MKNNHQAGRIDQPVEPLPVPTHPPDKIVEGSNSQREEQAEGQNSRDKVELTEQ